MERSSTKQIKGLETGLVYVGYSFQAYHVYSQSQCPLYQRPGASGALAGAGASAGDVRDMGSIPGFGRSLEKEMATNSSNLACKIPWTVAPGGL